MRYICITAALLLVTGCQAQSQVQYSYDVAKVDCQATAVADVAASNATAQRSRALKDSFSRCMRKQGFKLSSAKPPANEGPIDAGKRAPIQDRNQPPTNANIQPDPVAASAPAPVTNQANPAAQQVVPQQVAPQPAAIPARAATYQPGGVPTTTAPASPITVPQPATTPGRYF